MTNEFNNLAYVMPAGGLMKTIYIARERGLLGDFYCQVVELLL